MKLKCKTCNNNYHIDYILIIGPYWLENNKNEPMCINCFGSVYKQSKKSNMLKHSRDIYKNI